MATVVDTLLGTVLLQVSVRDCCPSFSPTVDLLFAVPACGYGILPAEASAFRRFRDSFVALCGRGWQVYLLSTYLVMVLLFPAFLLGLFEFGSCESLLYAISDTQIFFFRFVLPLPMLIQWSDSDHDVSMGIMSVCIVNTGMGTHTLRGKLFPYKI